MEISKLRAVYSCGIPWQLGQVDSDLWQWVQFRSVQQFSPFEEINALIGVSNGCISSCSILHPINHDMKRSFVNESDWNVMLTMGVF